MELRTIRLRHIIVAAVLTTTLTACTQLQTQAFDEPVSTGSVVTIGTAQAERDEIYMLLAYAVVLKNWQSEETKPHRGHNIGSILVDPKGEIVFWARNSNHITGNGTQHGEVRLMRNRLAETKSYDLKGHTIYTSLEPCAMCSGMMVLTSISRTVYGQTDPGFGKALERLSLDSRKLSDGYGPYPRKVISQPSSSPIRKRLDEAYARYTRAGGSSLTKWLLSEDARQIYQDALIRLQNYRVRYTENQKPLDRARAYYQSVPDHYVELRQ